ncbi:UGSC family (seleno)protein [Phytohabitans suffuscus]|uniref:UGSC-like domain-containing protein n=1 Tax=Phytohabitans suffuscus TaxID=624315 RepID=A0A6F8YV12_9ACTN|nr:hypothetical protein [Phytohabitans suffuscus]BCB90015.1 hypothetical protein Psuf_073280 [Phytohabitans suffuscus]
MATIEVLNPVALSAKKQLALAPRVPDLAGKRVGLFWNMKAGGDVALQRVQELLGKRYPTAEFTLFIGDTGSMVRRATKAGADRVAAESDVVVGTTGDCGSCTSWLIHDMVEFEKRGVPTVALTARGFEADARFSADTFGLSDLPFVVAESTFTSHSPEQIREMVEPLVGGIVAALTDPDLAGAPAAPAVDPAAAAHANVRFLDDRALAFTGADGVLALEEMNERFLEYGWGDGFPLYPPTRQRVDQMLTGTKRDPESVVGILEPGFGIATVEMIAANAVMAGCRPEHLPVVIAAIECIADPTINLRGKAMSTGTQAPMIIVNGPVRERIGLNSGCCALGPGAPSRVNTVIGRALRLCMMNIGHTYPQLTDMDTMGSPTKYSMCIAENQERSPWEPYHVARGFDAGQSTVTIHFNYGYSELHDFESHTPEDLIQVYKHAAMNLGSVTTGFWLVGRRSDPRNGTEEMEHDFMLICPEHAEIFGNAGWSRQDVRDAMFEAARLPYSELRRTKEAKALDAAHPELTWLRDSPDTLLPVLETPECFEVAVLGATAGRGQFYWGCGGPVTKVVDDV